MYKRHKILCLIISLVVTVLSFLLNIEYSKIAEIAITVVSIALAVYIGAACALLGSPYAEKLRSIRDVEDNTRTSLGVLAHYLRAAGFFSVITIIISSVSLLDIDLPTILRISPSKNALLAFLHILKRVISAASCGLFFVNVLFIWLILLFLINSISKSVQK